MTNANDAQTAMTHVYLDDIREPPKGWHLVKTADECIAVLAAGGVEYLSLDHDLAAEHYASEGGYFDAPKKCREKTGYDVVKWMVETNTWPSVSVTLHTANPVGRQNMRALIERYKPEGLRVYG